MRDSSSASHKIPNPVKRTAIVWWILSFVSLAGIFSPFILELFSVEALDWGPPLFFISLVFGITAVIVAVIYTRRARLVNRMLNKHNLLAHWTYSREQWAQYAEKEHEENKRDKKNKFILISAISVVVGIILCIIHPDGIVIFIFVILGIIIIMGCTMLLSIWLPYRRNRKYLGDVYISEHGVYLNRVLHTWKGFGAELEEASYHSEQPAQSILKIVYSTPNRYSRDYFTVRVRVPPGEEGAALIILEQIQRQAKNAA